MREHGGCCFMCARYRRSLAALHFRHLEPAEKAFTMADAGVALSFDGAQAESEKCVLLCANCHAEVEMGVARVPFEPCSAPLEQLVSASAS